MYQHNKNLHSFDDNGDDDLNTATSPYGIANTFNS